MSPYAAAATAHISTSKNPDPITSAQLERVVVVESSRWLPSLLSDLRLLETSGQNIPGVGDLRVSNGTADHVRRLLTVISGTSIPEPALAPFSGGGVALTCNIGDRELTFSAYPEHNDFVFVRTDDSGEPVDDGIITLEQTRRVGDLIAAFLANPPR
jgi:hypothetical protein